MFQPLYDAYLPLVRRAGGVPRLGPADAAGLAVRPREALDAAFTPRTRLVVLNNPLNPTGDDVQRGGPGAARRVLRRA